MADALDEILDLAGRLGRLIREHPRYTRLREADAQVRDDKVATDALEAYNQTASRLAEKERAGRPIEVADKQNLQQLHQAVAGNDRVKVFTAAQADYAEMMRRMNDTIFQAIAGSQTPAANPAD